MSNNVFTKKDFLSMLDDMLPDEPLFYGFSVKIGMSQEQDIEGLHDHVCAGLDQFKHQFPSTEVTLTHEFFPRTVEIKVNA